MSALSEHYAGKECPGDSTDMGRSQHQQMRDAINDVELALNGLEIDSVVRLFEAADDSVMVKVPLGALRRLARCYPELNRIINDDTFVRPIVVGQPQETRHMSEGKAYLKAGEGTREQIAEYKLAFAMVQSPDWEKNSIPKAEAAAAYTSEAKILALETALKTAIGHLKHMAAFIEAQNAGYQFEGLNEDMAAIIAAMDAPPVAVGQQETK